MTPDSIVKLLIEHSMDWDDVDGAWCHACQKWCGNEREWAEHVASLIAVGFAH